MVFSKVGVFMKLKKGGIESIIAAVVIVGIVIGLIATVVKDVANTGENTIGQGIEHLSTGMPTMNTVN